ncbi:hypothetical protein FXV77_05855 [Sphingobacterium phlebotomi]|uniref:F5/8 type C domain-containing protein n=1 Tax=Sphingobacterium phlebotomi TaxID=2605433 RepID=A0A5D4HA61_9SPHI|nr:hypothetical protein [Sphingobacterium phlebotomi]TYR37527.1 hypothetical protein FXV77_05855 [Sphingobacterium phlebotomi]
MRILLIILWSIAAQFTYGQLATWNLGGPSPTNGREASVTPTFVKEGMTVSDLSKGPLVKSRQGNARGFSGHLAKDIRTFDEAFENNAYFEFTIGVEKGHVLSISRLKAKLRIQEFSAKNFQWTYSLDGTNFKNLHDTAIQMSNLSNSGSNQPSLDLSQIKDLQNVKAKSKITFRLYVWGNDNSQDKGKISVGFGKSDAKNNSPVLKLEGSITKS